MKGDHVSFRHACRGDPDRYSAQFGCDVRFAQAQEGIVFQRQGKVWPLFDAR